MPELPEVETVVNALKPHLKGEMFTAIHTYISKLRSPLDIDDRPELINQRILHLKRRAKYIILQFENQYGLILHLGMTGSWRIESTALVRQKHDHAEFYLSNGLVLRYNDPRRFGQIVVTEPADLGDHKMLANLGPEPLSDDFDINWIKKVCANKNKPIKSLIMDNSMVVGIGNIYASESLFRAGISPLLPAGSISTKRLKKLILSIKEVLTEAIKAGGSTIKDYTSLNGEEGKFSRSLMVYGRTGLKCTKCKKGIIRKLYQSGRSTFFCPVCQR